MDTRIVHTRIWEDSWFSELSPEAKLIFLYCITNKEIKASGAFEKSYKTICFDTNISRDRLDSIFQEISEKVVYLDGYIFVKNAFKYQNYFKESATENQKKGFVNEILRLPESIRQLVINQLLTSCQLVDNYISTRLNIKYKIENLKTKKENQNINSEIENEKDKTEIPEFVERINEKFGITGKVEAGVKKLYRGFKKKRVQIDELIEPSNDEQTTN